MNRKEAFAEVARSGRAIADLCDKQKDTVDWWTQFGAEFEKFNQAVLIAKPNKDTHTRAAVSEMEKVRAAKEQTT